SDRLTIWVYGWTAFSSEWRGRIVSRIAGVIVADGPEASVAVHELPFRKLQIRTPFCRRRLRGPPNATQYAEEVSASRRTKKDVGLWPANENRPAVSFPFLVKLQHVETIVFLRRIRLGIESLYQFVAGCRKLVVKNQNLTAVIRAE